MPPFRFCVSLCKYSYTNFVLKRNDYNYSSCIAKQERTKASGEFQYIAISLVE